MQETPSNPDLIICPYCEKPYSFIRCRVTQNGKHWCLSCPQKKLDEDTVKDV